MAAGLQEGVGMGMRRRRGGALWRSAAAGLACAIALAGAGAARAEPPTTDGRNAPASHRLLSSDNPTDHGILNALLKRLFGKVVCEKMAHSRSEVWTIPQSRIGRLEQQLLSLGIKFALLREDWNHILRRERAPMSPAQQESLAKVGHPAEMV